MFRFIALGVGKHSKLGHKYRLLQPDNVITAASAPGLAVSERPSVSEDKTHCDAHVTLQITDRVCHTVTAKQ